jgi:hypothetical protein
MTRAALIALIALALGGCSVLPRAKLASGSSAIGPRDNGTPARVESSGTVSTLPIPAQSTVTASATGETVVTLSAPTVLRTETRADSATSGTIDASTAKHRIDSDRRATLARTQMLAGIALMVGGVLLAFALPPGLRWPQAGLYVAAAGLVLVVLRDPPTWLLALLAGCAAATVLAYYSTRDRRNA